MPVAKAAIAEIRHAVAKFAAAAAVVTVIKHNNASVSKQPDGRDIVAEVAWQPRKPVTSPDTEMITGEIGRSEKTRSCTRVWAVVPGTVPISAISVIPGITVLGAHQSHRHNT